jgi:hypothetical protein
MPSSPSASSPDLATAREELAQSIQAISAVEQKLASILGFAGVIIGLIFVLPASMSMPAAPALWASRVGLMATAILAVGGLWSGTADVGPRPGVVGSIEQYAAAWMVNMYYVALKTRLFRWTCVALLVGLLALIMAII